GTVIGLLLARAGVRLLMALGPRDLPRLDAVAVDPVVLGFPGAAGRATAVLCGVVPALRASRTDVMEVLCAAGGRSGGLRGGPAPRRGGGVAGGALSFFSLLG